MVNDQLSQMVRRWVYRIRKPDAAPRNRTQLRLEEYEARLAPAVLPAVTATDNKSLTFNETLADTQNGNSPSAAMSPAEPNKLVLASTDSSGIRVQYTTDGGTTWFSAFTTERTAANDPAFRMIDPSISPSSGNRVYTNSSSPSVAIDRAGNVYVVSTQHNADKSNGAVVLHKFQFGVGQAVPVLVDLDPLDQYGFNNSASLAYRWAGSDPALNVTVGVDNNVPTYTIGGSTFVDTLAAETTPPVFIAWNTNADAASSVGSGNVFNPNTVVMVASPDGGSSFSGALPVSRDNGGVAGAVNNSAYIVSPNSTYGSVSPKIAFSQGNGTTGGGLMTLSWTRISGVNPGAVVTDTSAPDAGGLTSAAVSVSEFVGNGGAVTDNPVGADLTVKTTLTAAVSAGNPPTTPADTTINVTSTANFPASNFYVRVGTEVMLVTGKTATTFTVARGQAGTVAGNFSAPADVTLIGVVGPAGIPTANAGDTTTFGLLSVVGFPPVNQANPATPPYTITIDSETMIVTGVDTVNNTLTVTRPFSPVAHAANARVILGRQVNVTGQGTTFAIPVSIDPTTFGTITDLDVKLSFQSPNLRNYKIELIAPNGQKLTLLENRFDGVKDRTRNGLPFGVGGNNSLGQINGSTNANGVAATFSDQAPRSINDPSNGTVAGTNFDVSGAANTAETAYVGDFRPDTSGATNGQTLLALVNSLTLAQLQSGQWTLQITDFQDGPVPPAVFINPKLLGWSLKFTGQLSNTGFGSDNAVTPTVFLRNTTTPQTPAVVGGADNVNPQNKDLLPTVGVGPGVSIAYDRTLYVAPPNTNPGVQTAHPGRMYLVYTGVFTATPAGTVNTAAESNDTNIYLVYSDNNGLTWSNPIRVNDDSVTDNFTQGNRPQFQPTVTVDPLTGTVVVMWYDARYDAAGLRAATYLATSIDGGNTFSQQTSLNTPRTAIDAITGQTVFVEPTPTNLQNVDAGGSRFDPDIAHGVGSQAAVIAYGGRINPFWTGNLNAAGSDIWTAKVSTAGGPRIIKSDMGPVTGTAQFLDLDGVTPVVIPQLGTATYNSVLPDGTRKLDGFILQFDRSIDPQSILDAVAVYYQSAAPGSIGAGYLLAANTVPAAQFRLYVFAMPTVGYAPNSVFFVQFRSQDFSTAAPQTGIGSYSYLVDPTKIRDLVGNPLSPTVGNLMDQNANGVEGEGVVAGVRSNDVYANPKPTNGVPFQGPYTSDTLPIILPGPRLVSSTPTGQTVAVSGVAVNLQFANLLNVTFDREVQPDSFRTDASTGPLSGIIFVKDRNGNFLTVLAVAPVDNLGNPVTTPTRFFRVATSAALSTANGPYTVAVNTTKVRPDNVFVNAGATGIDLAFDVAIQPDSTTATNKSLVFDSTDILQLVGPTNDGNSSLSQTDGLNGSNPFTVIPLDPNGSGAVQMGPAFSPTRYYRVTFPVRTVSGSYSLQIGPGMATPTGFGLDTNLNAGLDQVRGGATTGGTIATNSYTGTGGPGGTVINTLPAQTLTLAADMSATATTLTVTGFPVDSNGNSIIPQTIQIGSERLRVISAAGNTLTVTRAEQGTAVASYLAGTTVAYLTVGGTVAVNIPDEITIRQDLVRFPNQRITVNVNLTTGNLPDLIGTLIAPDGTRITLFTQVGSTTASGFQFGPTFDDGAGTPIQGSTGTSFTTNIQPQLPLSALAGHGGKGVWKLEVTNVGPIGSARINSVTITLPYNPPSNGLSEQGADQFQVGFRVAIQDPTNPTTQQQWTPVGPATGTSVSNVANNPGAAVPNNAGRVNAIAIDPSDATGNTVYAGGALGGVWKTTNFLTTDPKGPTWTPLTDFGPNAALAISSIVVIPRLVNPANPSQGFDPNQSIVFALTGEGNPTDTRDEGSNGNGSGAGKLRTGVGLLRSLDGGKTWVVLDSTDNDAADNFTILPITTRGTGANQRDGAFYGTNGYKVVFDPTPFLNPRTGRTEYYVYMALTDTDGSPGGNNGGVWRSDDTGRTWTRIQAGNATDVVLAAGSASINSQLQVLYAGFQDGVYATTNATTTPTLQRLVGGNGNANILDRAFIPSPVVGVQNAQAPTGGGGGTVVTLAVPTAANNPLQNQFYQNWLYAMVTNGTGLVGLFVTKDGGNNWTKVVLPSYYDALNDKVNVLINGNLSRGETYEIGYGTNDESNAQLTGWTTNKTSGLAIDPNNPSVVYLSGRYVIRVDTTLVNGTQTMTYTDNSSASQTGVITSTTGALQNGSNPAFGTPNDLVVPISGPTNATGTYGGYTVTLGVVNPSDPNSSKAYSYSNIDTSGPLVVTKPAQFLNLIRDPGNPFSNNSTLYLANTLRFTNTGENAVTSSYLTQALAGMDSVYSMITYIDPLTGKARLIFGTAQGVATGVDRGDGRIEIGIGFADSIDGSRNGNLQLGQFYAGAAQPSQTAADVAGALFYGMSEENGFQASSSGAVLTGNANYTAGGLPSYLVFGNTTAGPLYFTSNSGLSAGAGVVGGYAAIPPVARGTGTNVVTDPTGTGTTYEFRVPEETDTSDNALLGFLRQFIGGAAPFGPGTIQTLGLDATANGAGNGVTQWGQNVAIGGFAVNPFNPNALVIGSGAGRVYESTNRGLNWQLKSDPSQGNSIDGSGIRSVAFGAPATATPSITDNVLYAGTISGRVYVTRTGAGPWTQIFAGDGTPVLKIEADPALGSTDLFVVTQKGVYYLSYTAAANGTVSQAASVTLTGNLFAIGETSLFGENISTATFSNDGSSTSQFFALQPNSLTSIAVDWRTKNATAGPTVYAAGDGGVFRLTTPPNITATPTPTWASFGQYLPNTLVTDLDLSIGNFRYNPATGISTTDAAGGYNLLLASTYGRGQYSIRLSPDIITTAAVKVSQLENPNVAPANASTPGSAATKIRVDFSGPVDPNTFGTDDVQLYFTAPGGQTIDISNLVTRVQLISVTDSNNQNPRNQYDITFTPPVNGANGTAAQNAGTYGIIIGANTTVTDLSGRQIDRTANLGTIFLNGPATTLAVTTTTQPAVAGAAFTVTVTATEFDPNAGPSGVNGPIGGTVTDTGFDGVVTLDAGDPTARIFKNGVELPRLNGNGKYVYDFNPATDAGTSVFTVIYTKAQSWTFVAADADPAVNGVAFDAGSGSTGVVVVGGTAAAFQLAVNNGAPVGAGTPASITLTGFDQFGNQATTYNGTVAFALTGFTDPGATFQGTAFPGFYTFTQADAGKHTFTNGLTLTKTGNQVLAVSDTKNSAIATTTGVQVVGGAAATITLTGPGAAVAGQPATFTVSAKDKFGNNADTAKIGLTFSSSDPQSTPGNGLPSGAALTGPTGNYGAILKTAGTTTVSVSSPGLPTPSPVTVQVSPSTAAGSFLVSGYPSSVTAGSAGAFQVTVFDPFGNRATGYTGTVTFSSTDRQAGLPAAYTFQAGENGQHTFQATLRTAGVQSITVSDPNGVTGTQTGITVGASSVLGGLTLTGLPATAAAGDAVPFTVTVADPFGNAIPGFTGTVRFASSDSNATLPGAYTFTAADGGTKTFQASFTKAGPQTISVVNAADASQSATSGAVGVTPAAAATFTLAGFDSGGVAAGIPGTFTVTVRDRFGNVVTGYNSTPTFSSSDTRARFVPGGGFSAGVGTFQVVFGSPGTHSVTATDPANAAVTGSLTGIQVFGTPATKPPLIVVGSDAGRVNLVTVYNPDLSVQSQFQPFEQNFSGGVRVAVAQTPNPNEYRFVVAPGPGRQPDVKIFDQAANQVRSFLPFETSFTGGVFVSTGDINRDGFDDYIASPDEGGGPRVIIVNGRDGSTISDFLGIDDANFRGGARTAVADVNGDGFVDVVVAAGFGGGPRIAIYDGKALLAGQQSHLVPDFFAFEPALRNGAYVAAGDITGDGKAELIFGGGPGGAPRVLILDGATGVANGFNANNGVLANFFAGNTENRGGVRVAASNLDGDMFADVVVGDGVGGGATTTAYYGKNVRVGDLTPGFSIDTLPGFQGGIFVG